MSGLRLNIFFSFVSYRGLRAMPEESHSAPHQGPMGEGKITICSIDVTYAFLTAFYKLDIFMI